MLKLQLLHRQNDVISGKCPRDA